MKRALILITLCACSPFPDLDDYPTPGLTATNFPRIQPVEGLIIKAIGGASTQGPTQFLDDVSDPLADRIARLNARAAILRGAAVNDATRRRLLGQ